MKYKVRYILLSQLLLCCPVKASLLCTEILSSRESSTTQSGIPSETSTPQEISDFFVSQMKNKTLSIEFFEIEGNLDLLQKLSDQDSTHDRQVLVDIYKYLNRFAHRNERTKDLQYSVGRIAVRKFDELIESVEVSWSGREQSADKRKLEQEKLLRNRDRVIELAEKNDPTLALSMFGIRWGSRAYQKITSQEHLEYYNSRFLGKKIRGLFESYKSSEADTRAEILEQLSKYLFSPYVHAKFREEITSFLVANAGDKYRLKALEIIDKENPGNYFWAEIEVIQGTAFAYLAQLKSLDIYKEVLGKYLANRLIVAQPALALDFFRDAPNDIKVKVLTKYFKTADGFTTNGLSGQLIALDLCRPLLHVKSIKRIVEKYASGSFFESGSETIETIPARPVIDLAKTILAEQKTK